MVRVRMAVAAVLVVSCVAGMVAVVMGELRAAADPLVPSAGLWGMQLMMLAAWSAVGAMIWRYRHGPE